LIVLWFLEKTCTGVQFTQTQQQQGNITHTTTLSQARYELVATSSGELVFFGGGINSTGKPSNRVDIYNVTSGSWTTSTLSIPRGTLASTSSQNLVFFGGGSNGGRIFFDKVDIYNTLNGVGALQLSLNLVIILQPLLLEILFSLEVVTIPTVLPMLLMYLM
jgi:hypothetical protein